MNHYKDFDPYVIRERNQQVHREVIEMLSSEGQEIDMCARLA